MISFVVAAALSIAPEANAGIFNRRRGRAASGCVACAPVSPAPCNSCGSQVPAPCSSCGSQVTYGGPLPSQAPPVEMPKGSNLFDPARNPVQQERIEIPPDLQTAINASDQRSEIVEHLQNSSIPRQDRLNYLENVRQRLLVNTKD
jgi:hypothetical protein